MSRYDGLIIPRSYNEYINKTDPVAMSQALQLSGVLSAIVAAGDNKAVKSSAVYEALTNYINKTDAATLQQALQLPGVLSGAVAAGDNKAVTSNAVNNALANYINDKYCKNIIPPNNTTREISFPLKEINWFCGEVFGNLNNYGNICFYIDVSVNSISKTNIIGDSAKINITIDETNYSLQMSCSNNYSFNSITFIHS